MSFKLKKEENAFQVLREGKFEYRRYEHGKAYDEVPPEDAHRFEESQSVESIAHSGETKKTRK
jgi:hypothetical protein